MANPPEIPVRHNVSARRYETEVNGLLAVAEYDWGEGGVQVFTHTLVPEALRGRGLAEALVRTALDDAGSAGREVVPACSYVARFIERHQDYAPLLA